MDNIMKILNLVNLEKSDIKYLISEFPDGQQQVKIILPEGAKLADEDGKWSIPVKIKARLNNFNDLELIICVVKSLRGLNVEKIHLYTPYFLGSRSDRKFEEGSNNYLKDVICPIINSLNFESVIVLDPHSQSLECCLNSFVKYSNESLVRSFMSNKYGHIKIFNESCLLISPDAGASHKIYKLAEQIGYKGDIITCSKERDNNGKLTRTNIGMNVPLYKDIIIIDDICDGGATFINIAKELKVWWDFHEVEKQPKIYLIVTHGIFSKGFVELNKYFDGIYCTNSYRDLEFEGDLKNKVKQLDIF